MGDFNWLPEGIIVEFSGDYITLKYKGMNYGAYTASKNMPKKGLREAASRLERRVTSADRRTAKRSDRRE
ncbi:MAG: hypothetical protein V1886_00895 [archaeon]